MAQPALKRIQQLTTQLANQIAAGEVVERPASVIKELLENSIDAGATRIDIDIEQGGLSSIRLQDNGCGIHPDDMPLALSRHATSKIGSLSDLEAINSLGFRGEALPSIASVSRLQLISRSEGASQGNRVEVSAEGSISDVIPAAHPVGTTVVVDDLFGNVPARRRFQRAAKTEFSHIQDVVQRISLANPALTITLKHNGRQALMLPAANSSHEQLQRIGKVFGKQFVDAANRVDNLCSTMKIYGYVAPPEVHRALADRQYVYINARTVKDRLLSHAIRQAYEGAVPEGRFASYIIFIEMDPKYVDVNVHPTKHEVRFRDNRAVHDFLYAAIQRGLTPVEQQLPMNETALQPVQDVPLEANRVQEKAAVYNMPLREVRRTESTLPFGDVSAVVEGRFVICTTTQRSFLVDVERLQQSVLAERLQEQLGAGVIDSRPLLVPERINVTEQHAAIIDEHADVFTALGFELTLGGQTIALLRRAPVVLQASQQSPLVLALFETILSGEDPLSCSIDKLAKVAAANTALPSGMRNVQTWLAKLAGDVDIATNPTWLRQLDTETLATFFTE